MFEYVKTVGLLKIALLMLMCDLGMNKKERVMA